MSFYFVAIDLVRTKKITKRKKIKDVVLTNMELLEDAWRLENKIHPSSFPFLKKSSINAANTVKFTALKG